MKKAREYYKASKHLFAQDDCHGETSYPDEAVEQLIIIASMDEFNLGFKMGYETAVLRYGYPKEESE